MLDFYFIRDDQPNSTPIKHLLFAGGIEEEEFEKAQAARIAENHLDYYSKFRWSGEQVRNKVTFLQQVDINQIANLADILKQAKAAESGLAAFGD